MGLFFSQLLCKAIFCSFKCEVIWHLNSAVQNISNLMSKAGKETAEKRSLKFSEMVLNELK